MEGDAAHGAATTKRRMVLRVPLTERLLHILH